MPMDKPGHSPANSPLRAYMHVSYVVASGTVPAHVTKVGHPANARGRKVAKVKEPKAKVKAKAVAVVELSRRATMHVIHPQENPNSVCKQHLLPQ